MSGLIAGELRLTFDVIFGSVAGELIMRSGICEKILRFMSRFLRVNPVTVLAISVSAGSSRTGAGIIAAALEKNIISEREAIWSVLMLPFPSYLKRWFSTFALSVSIAGLAGGIFAVFLLLRSAARFFVALIFLRSGKFSSPGDFVKLPETPNRNFARFCKYVFKNLVFCWIFFALTYALIPFMNNFLEEFVGDFSGSIIPISGWAIAAGSIAHVTTALALTGGSLEHGDLSVSQAVFMLILGSALGTVTRILRQNAGYYFGMFERKLAAKMLIMNFVTILPFIICSVIISGLFLLL